MGSFLCKGTWGVKKEHHGPEANTASGTEGAQGAVLTAYVAASRRGPI